MNLSYFIVICEEIDMFDGKIVHVDEKAKNIEEAYQIVTSCLDKYPTAHWELYPCFVKM